MNKQPSLLITMQLIVAALAILVVGVLMTSLLGAVGGSALDLSMIVGAAVVVGSALALSVTALAGRHE